MHICGNHLKHGHSFINHIFNFYVYEPCVILWENTNAQAVTEACWLFTLNKMYCTMIIIVSVLNEVEWLVCLFHSASHIIIDQETNRGGHLLNKNIGEI